MERQRQKFITVFYDPNTRQVLGRGGKFVSLKEFAEYPPTHQEELVPPSESIPDPADVPEDPGPVIKCINNLLHVCYNDRCNVIPPGIPCKRD